MTWLAFVVSASERWILDPVYRLDAPRWASKFCNRALKFCPTEGYNTLRTRRWTPIRLKECTGG